MSKINKVVHKPLWINSESYAQATTAYFQLGKSLKIYKQVKKDLYFISVSYQIYTSFPGLQQKSKDYVNFFYSFDWHTCLRKLR